MLEPTLPDETVAPAVLETASGVCFDFRLGAEQLAAERAIPRRHMLRRAARGRPRLEAHLRLLARGLSGRECAFCFRVAGHPLAQNERCLHMFLQDQVIDRNYVPGKIRNT